MSAHLSPEELKRIFPDEYDKQYGEKDADRARLAEIRSEVKRLNAETRLLNARRRNERAKTEKPKAPDKSRRESPAAVARWIIAIIAFIAQLAFTVYIMKHY